MIMLSAIRGLAGWSTYYGGYDNIFMILIRGKAVPSAAPPVMPALVGIHAFFPYKQAVDGGTVARHVCAGEGAATSERLAARMAAKDSL
nr:hypothetical protein [uncultured Rhodopila sp.]